MRFWIGVLATALLMVGNASATRFTLVCVVQAKADGTTTTLNLVVDTDASTVNKFPAKIDEGRIFFELDSRDTHATMNINRYTGDLEQSVNAPNLGRWTNKGQCQLATRPKF
jgi:hypothetical protein